MKQVFYFTMYLLSIFMSMPGQAQKGYTEFEKRRIEASLDNATSTSLITDLKGTDIALINRINTILTTAGALTPVKGSAVEINSLSTDVSTTITAINNRGDGDPNGENAAVVILYRDITLAGAGPSEIDFTSLKTLIYHKKRNNAEISNYLLETKKVFFVFIDMHDDFYDAGDIDKDKKLSNSTIKIEYRNSLLKQSFLDLKSAFGMMGGGNHNINSIKLTIIEIEPKRIKAPCDIIVSNKAFNEDVKFNIHERNFASFQIGVENSKYQLNNFSITGGTLVVKPNTDQTENWKSNLKAMFEIHIPRDIDNFRPVWKDLTTFDRPALKWLYDFTLSRIGVYGGLKLGKDPFSNYYAGVNYAITKEVYINFGYSWEHEIVPQVTEIGNISTLKEAKEFAIRKYSPGKFSWGLSFAPGAVIKMLGLKAKE